MEGDGLVWRLVFAHDDEELLAFALDADDMDIGDTAQLAQCLGDVEHGRELDHDGIAYI